MKKIDITIKNNNLNTLIIKDNNQFTDTIDINLLNIKNKYDNNLLLSKEELIYLYNLFNQNKFNLYEKLLIERILSNRDSYQDLAYNLIAR